MTDRNSSRSKGAAHNRNYVRFVTPDSAYISAVGAMSFSTAVGRRPPWATFSVLQSHKSEDPGSKVGRRPRFGPATVLKDIAPSAVMSLSCSIRGSFSAWESWWVAAEGEHGEGDERLGAVEPERDPGE